MANHNYFVNRQATYMRALPHANDLFMYNNNICKPIREIILRPADATYNDIQKFRAILVPSREHITYSIQCYNFSSKHAYSILRLCYVICMCLCST